MNQAGAILDLSGTPVWALWLFAIVGSSVFASVLFWIMPPALRKGSGLRSVLSGAAFFFVAAAVSGGSRAILWYGAVGFVAVSVPIFFIGKLPTDMPSARDPSSRRHPQFKKFEGRGRIAGMAIILLIIVMVILTQIFVRGLD